jgi:hypothetical protein
VYILPKLILEIYNITIIKIIIINIVNGTTVTSIIKGQNNHTLNNKNKHRGVQLGWSVRLCPSAYGRQQCSALYLTLDVKGDQQVEEGGPATAHVCLLWLAAHRTTQSDTQDRLIFLSDSGRDG